MISVLKASSISSTEQSFFFKSSVMCGISRRLDEAVKAKVLEIADEMFTSEQADLRRRTSELLEKLQILPFRELKFPTRLYYDQSDEKVSKKIKEIIWFGRHPPRFLIENQLQKIFRKLSLWLN